MSQKFTYMKVICNNEYFPFHILDFYESSTKYKAHNK